MTASIKFEVQDCQPYSRAYYHELRHAWQEEHWFSINKRLAYWSYLLMSMAFVFALFSISVIDSQRQMFSFFISIILLPCVFLWFLTEADAEAYAAKSAKQYEQAFKSFPVIEWQ